ARGFAPARVGPRHHRSRQDIGVPVQDVFDLDGRNVLATGNDDVFAAVFDFHIAVGVHDGQVAAVEPATGQGFLRGLGVLQVTLHGDVAAEHDFAHGFA